MERFEIHRNAFGNWTVITLGLVSLADANERLQKITQDNPQFAYRIVRVSQVVELEVPAVLKRQET